MKMSHKLIILFSLLAVCTTLANTAFYYTNLTDSMYKSTQKTLVELGEKMQSETEQYVQLMDYAIASITSNVEFMNAMEKASLPQDTGDVGEMMAAQTLMSRILYQSPLLEDFYRISVYARNSFFLTSHFDKTNSVVSMSDEAEETIASLPYLAVVDQRPLERHLIGPHADPWSRSRSIEVFAAVRALVLHGKFIGYVEVAAPETELENIFAVQSLEGVTAQAVFDGGGILYKAAEDEAIYENVPSNAMTHCVFGDSERLVVCLHCKTLGISIYVAQDLSVFNQQLTLDLLRSGAVSLAVLAFTIVLVMVFSMRLTRSTRRLTKKLSGLNTEKLLESPDEELTKLVSSPQDKEIYHLETVFNALMMHLKASMKSEMTNRECALQAQLNALQTQINPHFVYNTLNIISTKGMESGNEEIVDLCAQFAQMLRYSTDLRSRTASLNDELQNARRYLTLSKARYEDTLEFSITVPEEIGDLQLPKLTLQPIVENALTHGFAGNLDVKRIAISGQTENGILHLTIRDNGQGFSPEMLDKLTKAFDKIDHETDAPEDTETGHIGLVNTYLRLHFYSKGKMRMTLRNEGGAVVELTLPCERRETHVSNTNRG